MKMIDRDEPNLAIAIATLPRCHDGALGEKARDVLEAEDGVKVDSVYHGSEIHQLAVPLDPAEAKSAEDEIERSPFVSSLKICNLKLLDKQRFACGLLKRNRLRFPIDHNVYIFDF